GCCHIIIPIRCFSCGKLIAHTYKPYLEMIEKGESSDEAFTKLGLERFCCRRMICSHVNLIDDLLKFSRLQ
ncbi:MAG: DNA-directed RNA polymerase subunit N, partial [Promethearchaeia archaeon]